MGVRHYIVKPFTAHDLHQRIDDVIAERGAAASGGTLDQTRIDAVMRPSARRSLRRSDLHDRWERAQLLKQGQTML